MCVFVCIYVVKYFRVWYDGFGRGRENARIFPGSAPATKQRLYQLFLPLPRKPMKLIPLKSIICATTNAVNSKMARQTKTGFHIIVSLFRNSRKL